MFTKGYHFTHMFRLTTRDRESERDLQTGGVQKEAGQFGSEDKSREAIWPLDLRFQWPSKEGKTDAFWNGDAPWGKARKGVGHGS